MAWQVMCLNKFTSCFWKEYWSISLINLRGTIQITMQTYQSICIANTCTYILYCPSLYKNENRFHQFLIKSMKSFFSFWKLCKVCNTLVAAKILDRKRAIKACLSPMSIGFEGEYFHIVHFQFQNTPVKNLVLQVFRKTH